MSMAGIDRVLHAPARLRIAALLAAVSEMEFARLRELVALAEAGYVQLRKANGAGRQRTWAALSRTGRAALTRHVAALRAVVAGIPA